MSQREDLTEECTCCAKKIPPQETKLCVSCLQERLINKACLENKRILSVCPMRARLWKRCPLTAGLVSECPREGLCWTMWYSAIEDDENACTACAEKHPCTACEIESAIQTSYPPSEHTCGNCAHCMQNKTQS